MGIVAGVDFGTLAVRISLFDKKLGRLESATAEYPLERTPADPDYATQRHQDHLDALERATHEVLRKSRVAGSDVRAMALDTTGSTVIVVGDSLEPLGDYYLWCDHRAWREAEEITRIARELQLEAIDWCGGAYSSEWGFAKLLHWLRNNPGKRPRMVTALEHCDMIAATLCGVKDARNLARSICAMGHKWMWNANWGGLPPESYLIQVDPLFAGVREKLQGRYATSRALAGSLSPEWAARLGLKAGIPIPVGALDAHWDAVGAGIRLGDVVNVIGTSTCIMAMSEIERLIPGVCGVVPGSIHPDYAGIEAGLSAVGDIFDAIARRAATTVGTLSRGLDSYRAGQTGLLRLCWDNGDRTVLVNPALGGITLGWNLTHTAQDELFAAIEGTAFHTRVILDRMVECGTPIQRVINGGGIPQRSDVLNRVYANVLGKPVLVPSGDVTSVGSAIFAFLAAGEFQTVEEAQDVLCPPHRTVMPDLAEAATYRTLFDIFRPLYFALGQPGSRAAEAGAVLPELRKLAEQVRQLKSARPTELQYAAN
jgi:L-ribulokinase